MDLQSINTRLNEIKTELPKAIKTLWETEYPYMLKYAYTLAHSPAGSREAREAEATLTCEQEGLLKPFQEARIEVRTLTHEKEILIEMSKNIRTLRGEE